MPQIPERLINFSVYAGVDRRQPKGMATVDLPDIVMMSDAISGAGIAGEVETPTLGHTESMTSTFNFRVFTGDHTKLMRAGGQDLTLRGSIQSYDSGAGTSGTIPVRAVMKGQFKEGSLGSFEPGSETDSSVEFEVTYLKLVVDNIERVEVDKFNFKYVVDGVDYLTDVRDDLGL